MAIFIILSFIIYFKDLVWLLNMDVWIRLPQLLPNASDSCTGSCFHMEVQWRAYWWVSLERNAGNTPIIIFLGMSDSVNFFYFLLTFSAHIYRVERCTFVRKSSPSLYYNDQFRIKLIVDRNKQYFRMYIKYFLWKEITLEILEKYVEK